MAITLPYPSLVFVPLDKLTAEEMNQIVANYTAIANAFPLGSNQIADGSVTTAKLDGLSVTGGKIANGAIGSSQINWSDLAPKIGYYEPKESESVSTSWKTLLSLNVSSYPVGTKFIAMASLSGTTDSYDGDLSLKTSYGSEDSTVYSSGMYSHSLSIIRPFTVTSGNTLVNLQARVSGGVSTPPPAKLHYYAMCLIRRS